MPTTFFAPHRLSAPLRWLALVGLWWALLACRAAPPPAVPSPALTPTATIELPLTLPVGYDATLFVEGLRGPTQVIVGPDGRLWVAQLNGGERDGTGQVLSLPLPGVPGEPTVLLDGLDKPTGIAVLDGALWIAAGNALLRAPLDESQRPGPPDTVLADLPFNGRSNGTLTLTLDGGLLFETSGARRGDQAAPGSATLWRLDPARPTEPEALAVGLKGAYAHAFDGAGRLWSTEIGDDPVGGAPPPDELNLIEPGADYGWPACYGAQQPAPEYGGSAERCAASAPPAALFPPRSTPVSVVASPWEADTLLVALWGPEAPAIVRLPISAPGGRPQAAGIEPFIGGLEHPQSLLALPDGTLLIADHGTGILYRVRSIR